MPSGLPSHSASSAHVPAVHTPPAPCIPAKLPPAGRAKPPDLLLLPHILHLCSRPPAVSLHSPLPALSPPPALLPHTAATPLLSLPVQCGTHGSLPADPAGPETPASH